MSNKTLEKISPITIGDAFSHSGGNVAVSFICDHTNAIMANIRNNQYTWEIGQENPRLVAIADHINTYLPSSVGRQSIEVSCVTELYELHKEEYTENPVYANIALTAISALTYTLDVLNGNAKRQAIGQYACYETTQD